VAFVVAVEVGTAMVVAVIVLVIVVATIVFSYYGLMDILLHPLITIWYRYKFLINLITIP